MVDSKINNNASSLKNDINYKLSEEASEILSSTPSWLLRWGTISILTIFGLLFILSTLIKYPDSLEGHVIVTTSPLPIIVKSNNTGRIMSLFLKEGAEIDKGEPIAELENSTGYTNILKLDSCSKSVLTYLKNRLYDSLIKISEKPIMELGDGQNYYNQLLQNISSFHLLQNEKIYAKRIQNLIKQVNLNKSLSKVNDSEVLLMEDDLKEAIEKFADNTLLYNNKVIAKHEFYDKAASLREKKMTEKQQKKMQLQTKGVIEDFNRQILEITFDKHEKERILITAIEEAVRGIQSYIQAWKQRYLLVAPHTGILFYMRPVQLNETITANDPVFMAVPKKHKYLAIAELSADGIGKVKEGMTAHLLLDNYPYNEYGYIDAIVGKISQIPNITLDNNQAQNVYKLYIDLPDSLTTTYHIPIPFNPNINGRVRIITRNKSLLQRLIQTISKLDK